MSPLGTWVANEVVPRFLDTLSNTIKILNQILEALKPLFQWFWDNVLKPLAEWTGGLFLSIWDRINDALGRFADWCKKQSRCNTRDHHNSRRILRSLERGRTFILYTAIRRELLQHLEE